MLIKRVKRQEKGKRTVYKKILVPLDGSKRAEAILPHVEQLAQRYQAKVIFLKVIEFQIVTGLEGAYVPLTDQEFDQTINQTEKYLAGIKGEFKEKKIDTQTCFLHGQVVNEIIKLAAREAVDLIAMASHGRGGLARAFYGSVAAGVLQNVDRPLLIIRSRSVEE
jgi:nucleotide-binding universal stress UspA family protein